ncbi:MAG: tyrosine-type recombinase/integrase, partial [Actinobacteria bacterium]|nr:tyrosine-type recombinase/integrase [Actinomycetota bacterium]
LHIYDAFGERRISQISSLDVEKWWAAMQVKLKPKSNPDAPDELYAPSSLNGILTTLGRVFHHAQKHQLITVNPCDAVDRIKMDHTEVEFYDPHEIAALLDYLDLTPPYGLIVRFACKTGLRPGELEALRIGDIKHVNFQRGHVEVVRQRQHTTKRGWKEKRTKTSAANRKVPLPPSLLSELRDHLAQHPHHDDPDALLWPGRDKGGDIRHNLTPEGADRRLNYNKALRCEGVYRSHVVPALEALGLRKLPWYSFRHFYASWSAAQGYQIETVAKRLGHSNLQIMYKHYLHLFSDHDDMSRLDALDTVAPVQRIPSLGVRGVV